ncbi:hypothetical protein ACWEN3_31505 [Streptomyces sp. NPDC004561]
MTPASFGTPRDADLLTACLDRCLRRPGRQHPPASASAPAAERLHTHSEVARLREVRTFIGLSWWRRPGCPPCKSWSDVVSDTRHRRRRRPRFLQIFTPLRG